MKVLIFGATGMVGQGVLRECLRDPGVTEVVALVRRPSLPAHPKLREVVHGDFFDYRAVEADLAGLDACFFCLGVSSAGLSEAEYRRLTFGLTLAAAGTLAHLNPSLTFVYVSGAGTDSTERGRTMWARVKGETENALRHLPFKAVYLFRPGLIQPLHGIRSRTGWYQAAYTLMKPALPLLRRLFPNSILTTEALGRAMLRAARDGASKAVLEAADLIALGASPGPAGAP
ncbi:NAD(P)H-binding protein [Geothrix alkalitolerans]|uniref:NAD(P)H-binding protein n=1 Tax=Geothrix alkalitolerans TaxID=2922724 RepID=UPI001FAEB3EB|nr:NAD(P)H-binding protein [Geothrix alkalitolerans]